MLLDGWLEYLQRGVRRIIVCSLVQRIVDGCMLSYVRGVRSAFGAGCLSLEEGCH